jgi:hypothetical protein
MSSATSGHVPAEEERLQASCSLAAARQSQVCRRGGGVLGYALDMRAAQDDASPLQRVETALELLDLAEALLRQRLRRTSPQLDGNDIDEAVRRWYDHRPGAELGDAPGSPREIPAR